MNLDMKNNIIEFLNNRVADCHILVVGDVMLDRYFYGSVERISPEAPVPVVLIHSQKDTLGGAANVVHNLAKLGCKVSVAGVIGNDYHGKLLQEKMQSLNVNTAGLLVKRKSTTTKTRILGGHQQMMRIDFEENEPVDTMAEEEIVNYVRTQIDSGVDAIIISDYGKGMCTENVCRSCIKYANKAGVTVFVDPKGNDWHKYSLADYITPNVKELGDVISKKLVNQDDVLFDVACYVKDSYKIKNVINTRSEKGISLFLSDEQIHIPTAAQEVFDVSGAGDTVIAAMAAGIAGGMSVYDAAVMANFAAGIGVGKVGTYAVSKEDMLKYI